MPQINRLRDFFETAERAEEGCGEFPVLFERVASRQRSQRVAKNWESLMSAAVDEFTAAFVTRRFERLEREIQDLKTRLDSARCVAVPIHTLAPEPFELIRDVSVMLEPVGEEYVASFDDANINASGETPEEAITNLKDMMVAVFDHLVGLSPEKLGPGPARQLAALEAVMRRKD